MTTLDLQAMGLREVNSTLHANPASNDEFIITNPKGNHAIACGLQGNKRVLIKGHAGFYCAGMNKDADVIVEGHVGVGVAENMMSGSVRVTGNASQSAGATAHGGLLVIEGDASSRCGISMKGIDIVVGGSVGHMSAFMAQAGSLVVCGDAGEALGDSIYEADLYVQGKVESLGSDCEEKELDDAHLEKLKQLLSKANISADANAFKRYGSARNLYNFHPDNAGLY